MIVWPCRRERIALSLWLGLAIVAWNGLYDLLLARSTQHYLFQQAIHQDIREFSPAEQTEGRQEGHSEWHGMPAELMGFFDRNPLAIRVEHARGQVEAERLRGL